MRPNLQLATEAQWKRLARLAFESAERFAAETQQR